MTNRISIEEKIVDREISATTRWGVGIIITIILQSAGVVWFIAGLNAKAIETERIARENSVSIKSLQQGASVIMTRDQLNDILGSRDARLDNIEKRQEYMQNTLNRIESKL